MHGKERKGKVCAARLGSYRQERTLECVPIPGQIGGEKVRRYAPGLCMAVLISAGLCHPQSLTPRLFLGNTRKAADPNAGPALQPTEVPVCRLGAISGVASTNPLGWFGGSYLLKRVLALRMCRKVVGGRVAFSFGDS